MFTILMLSDGSLDLRVPLWIESLLIGATTSGLFLPVSGGFSKWAGTVFAKRQRKMSPEQLAEYRKMQDDIIDLCLQRRYRK